MIKLFIAFLYYFYNDFITHVPLYWVRHWYLRHVLRIKIGKKSAIHMGCFFSSRKITIGHHSIVNRNCSLDGRAGIEIGDRNSNLKYELSYFPFFNTDIIDEKE